MFRSSPFNLFSIRPICLFFLLFLLQNTFLRLIIYIYYFIILLYYHFNYTGSGKQNNDPFQGAPTLSPGAGDNIILHGKRDFDDVIEVPDLETGRAS